MKTKQGFTLMELLLAGSMLVIVLFLGSSIYLSGMNVSGDTIMSSKAQTGACQLMMHLQKYVPEAATDILILNGGKTLEFDAYDTAFPDFSQAPSVHRKYDFDPVNKRVIYNNAVFFNRIENCYFEKDGIVLKAAVKTQDDTDNGCELKADIELGVTAYPSVHLPSQQ